MNEYKYLVTIITPAYNNENSLNRALYSLAQQTYKNIEVIIVDDGSVDDTSIIAKKYCDNDRRFHYYYKSNGGVSSARNYGLDHATGFFICFLDSDDELLLNSIELRVKALIVEGASFVHSGYLIKRNNKHKYINVKSIKSEMDFCRGNPIPMLTAMYRFNLYKTLRFKKVGHEDFVFWIELFQCAKPKTTLVQLPLAIYHETENSLSGNKFKTVIWTYRIYRNVLSFSVIKTLYCLFFYAAAGIQKRLIIA